MEYKKRYIPFFIVIAITLALLPGCGSAGEPKPDDTAIPDGFAYSDGLDENGFWEGVRALDYVELFDYHAIEIPNDIHQISDDVIQTEIDYIIETSPFYKLVKDRGADYGDAVNVDFEGTIDGVPFDSGSTRGLGTDIVIGGPSNIPDFPERLIGHKAGETFDITVTLPDDYLEEDLRGKKALFVTTINHITETVKELTDEYASEILYVTYGWRTAEAALEGIRAEIQRNHVQMYIREYFVTKVDKNRIPAQMVEYQEQAMLEAYRMYAYNYGVELDSYIKDFLGYPDAGALLRGNTDKNVENAAFCLVCQAIAEDAGMSVSEEDLQEFSIGYLGTSDYSFFEEEYGLPYLKQGILCQKVFEYVSRNAVLL